MYALLALMICCACLMLIIAIGYICDGRYFASVVSGVATICFAAAAVGVATSDPDDWEADE